MSFDWFISTPLDLFHYHHEANGGSADISLAFVGLHSALSLFNSTTCILLLPGWHTLDMGGDVIGKHISNIEYKYISDAHVQTR